MIGLGPIAFMLLLNALTSAAEEQPYWEYLFDRGLIHLVIWGGFGLFMIALGLRAIIKGIRAGRLRALDIQGKGSAPLR